MKGAIVLILMLLMGFITAQSIDAMGYDIDAKDRIYLQNIFDTIDKKGASEDVAHKFTPYLSYFPVGSREHILLHEIYTHIHKKPTHIVQSQKMYTQDMIELLSKQFQ